MGRTRGKHREHGDEIKSPLLEAKSNCRRNQIIVGDKEELSSGKFLTGGYKRPPVCHTREGDETERRGAASVRNIEQPSKPAAAASCAVKTSVNARQPPHTTPTLSPPAPCQFGIRHPFAGLSYAAWKHARQMQSSRLTQHPPPPAWENATCSVPVL